MLDVKAASSIRYEASSLITVDASIANVFHALSSDQPCRQGLPNEQVIDTLREMAGPVLNSKLVDLFLDLVPLFPVGTAVVVRSGNRAGYRGIVTKVPTAEMNRPVVRLLHDENQERIEPFELDLATEGDIQITAVR